jgi:DNA-binding NtrC family response regulator
MSTACTARRPVVLIVEDDLPIRLQAAQIIAGAEFDVIEASSANEAISILEARSDISVLFTDIQMPGSMDGLNWPLRSKGAGRRLKSSRPPAWSMYDRRTCPKVGASFLSLTILFS